MVKPEIKICTPFYNEFQCDSEGFVSIGLSDLPCEAGIKNLLIHSECVEDHYRQRYQLDNHLGSASLELDESSNVISYEEYHPFGTTSFRSADGK